jgi:hypothetical protein
MSGTRHEVSCVLLLLVSFLLNSLMGRGSRNEAAGMGILVADAASDILRSAIVPSHYTSMDLMRNTKHFRPNRWRKEGEAEITAVEGKRG